MKFNAGDTAWVLVAAALVLFMTPGLAFFYGGMVRSKNVLGMLMQNFFALGIVSVLWAIVGVFAGVRRYRRVDRQLRFRWVAPRGEHVCARVFGPDHSAPRVHVVPNDVRHHHARIDHRGDR